MEYNLKEIFTAFMVLFAVIDIIGNIPIILDLKNKEGNIHSRKASLIAGVIMISFLFIGDEMLNLIGIDVHSFAVAGAFVLFFLALEMVLGVKLYHDDANKFSATVFPVAFPLIAGPGTLTTILSIKSEYATESILIAITLNVIVVYIVLKTSGKIDRLIGNNGINIIRKIFGVILLAISVKLFVSNIQELIR
jgi:multiple antibiotic resistance protein